MKATCTWGDGPDVLVDLDGTEFLLYEEPRDLSRGAFGVVAYGSACFTAKEARQLAAELIVAADYAEEMEKSAEEYCREHP